MSDVIVLINGLPIDIAKTQEVAQTYAVNSFGDISSRNSAYSNTWEAPLTANNKRIFENSEIVVNSSTIPFQTLPCQVFVDGIMVVNGLAELLGSKGSYKLRIYGGNFDFFSSIKGLLISGLDLSDLDHAWNLVNIAASRTNTEGYIYPLIDYHDDSPNAYVNNTDREVDVRTLFPAVFLHTLIDRIISEAGFTKSGDLFSNVDYLSLVLPFSNDKFGYSEEYVLSQKFQASPNVVQQFLFNGNTTIPTLNAAVGNDYTLPNFDNGEHWNTATSRFTANGSVTTRFSMTWTNETSSGISSSVPFGVFRVDVYKNGVLNQTLLSAYTNGDTYVSSFMSLATGDYIDFKLRKDMTQTDNSLSVTSVEDDGTGTARLVCTYGAGYSDIIYGNTCYVNVPGYVGNFLVTATEVNFGFTIAKITINTPFVATGTGVIWEYYLGQPLVDVTTFLLSNEVFEDIAFGGMVPMSITLPKLKQADLFKCMLQKFGAIVQVDNENKIVYVKQFSEIVANIPNAIDWSDKVDESEETELSFKLGKYAQLNNFKYKEDESVIKPLATDYQLPISNDNLPAEIDLVESLFAASEMILRFVDLDTPQLKKLVAGAEVKKIKPRILSLRHVDIPAASPFTYTDNSSTVVTYTSLPLVHFILQSQGFNLGWVDLVNDHSSEIREVLQETKIINELLRLNSADINQLDFFIPAWLDKHKCYFFLSEVTQYKFTSKESTVVELVKLI